MQAKSAQIIKRCYVNKQHFIVQRNGFPLIAIIPLDEYDQLMKLLATAQVA